MKKFSKRLTVDEALDHPWLSDPALKDAKLAVDRLREFKYRHKWLVRLLLSQILIITKVRNHFTLTFGTYLLTSNKRSYHLLHSC